MPAFLFHCICSKYISPIRTPKSKRGLVLNQTDFSEFFRSQLMNSLLPEEPPKYLPFFWSRAFARPSRKDGLIAGLAGQAFGMRGMKPPAQGSSWERELLADRLVPAELILAGDQSKSGH